MNSSEAGYGTASIGGTAALLLSARRRRENVVTQNNHATQTLHLGTNSSVTTANGLKVAAGQSVTLNYKGAIYAIASGAATTVNYWESY
jgi:hypothetical protein